MWALSRNERNTPVQDGLSRTFCDAAHRGPLPLEPLLAFGRRCSIRKLQTPEGLTLPASLGSGGVGSLPRVDGFTGTDEPAGPEMALHVPDGGTLPDHGRIVTEVPGDTTSKSSSIYRLETAIHPRVQSS